MGRRLRILRVAILAWLALVLGHLLLVDSPFEGHSQQPQVLVQLSFVGLYLGALFLCRERPGLAAVALWGGLLFLLTVVVGWRDMDSIHDTGWRPLVWPGLLAFSQLTIVLAAGGAWLLAPPSGGATPYLATFLGGAAVVFLSAVICTPLAGRHPRMSPDKAAIGDIRTMISAQSAYQSANGGFYDVPECLFTPQRCIPAYPANAPTFIDPLLGQMTVIKSGYRRVFHPGPPADAAAVRQATASASSLQSWAYTAVPLVPGETGARGFCGDWTGILCFTPDGQAPGVENGLCAASCQVLQ